MYKSAYAVVLTVVDTQMATAKPWQQARLQILQEQDFSNRSATGFQQTTVARWLDKTAQELEPVLLIIDLNIQDNQNGLVTHPCSTK